MPARFASFFAPFPRAARLARRWLRPPRRLRFARSGKIFCAGALVMGLAAIATGNNLLFLLLGAMLGFITVSGWLSEQMVRRIEVARRVPRGGIVAGRPARIGYMVHNPMRRLPCYALEVGEDGAPCAPAWLGLVPPGETAVARAEMTWPRRGVYPLGLLVLGTSFPFGLFRKERDLEIPDEVVVWPRHDLRLREPRTPSARTRRVGESFAGAMGARGEYRGLRPYRPGDDPRDVHWKTSARLNQPVVREYERDRAHALWICVDLRTDDTEMAEAAAEVAASLAAAALGRGESFGLATGDVRIRPATGAVQLERVLDALARARFRADAPRLEPPLPRRECVLVTPRVHAEAGWGDAFTSAAGAAAAPPR